MTASTARPVGTNTGTDTWNINGFFNVSVRAQFVAIKTEQYRLLPPRSRTYVVPPTDVAHDRLVLVNPTLFTLHPELGKLKKKVALA